MSRLRKNVMAFEKIRVVMTFLAEIGSFFFFPVADGSYKVCPMANQSYFSKDESMTEGISDSVIHV